MKVLLLGVLFLAIGTIDASPRTQLDERIARAKSLELDTPYVPPPGDPLVHHTAGYAKVMCSAVFMTGLSPDFAAENVGFFTVPYELRAKLGKPVIDRADKAVHITLPNGVTRTAKYFWQPGCVTLPARRERGPFQASGRQRANYRMLAPSRGRWAPELGAGGDDNEQGRQRPTIGDTAQ